MLPTTPLTPTYHVPRIITGAWQLSGGHHVERLDREAIFAGWDRMLELGFTTFDCADIYTGVEELIGAYRRRRPDEPIRVHTKFVPDRDDLPALRPADVDRIIERSLRRLAVERLDLVQFAWWDYNVPGHVDAAGRLTELQRAGKIQLLGATNFDVPRLRELLDAGVPLVSHQIQYSLLDRRPENGMTALCAERGLGLLCYGTLAGGLLTDRYLGADEPHPPFTSRSLTKYKLIVEEFGGWAAHQALLTTAADIAARHETTLGTVALRYVLEKQSVAAAIVGARDARHAEEHLRAFEFALDDEDHARLDAATAGHGPAGDTFALERDPDGPHAAIMRYNLNKRED